MSNHNPLGCDESDTLDIVILPMIEPESPPITKMLRERIDRMREARRISWMLLTQMMMREVGKGNFREMTVRDGWIVVRMLEREGIR